MKLHFDTNFEWLTPEIMNVIADFDAYEAGFNTGKRNSVKKVELSIGPIIFKSFKKPHVLNQIVYRYFRKSKAQRSFEYAKHLVSLGFHTPSPIAYIESYNFVGLQHSYYISLYYDHDLTYRELIHYPDYPDKDLILAAFTKFTFDLHEKGVLFLDHSPGNTLIKKKDGTYEFALVDVNRMQFKSLSFDERMQNFARLTPQKEMVKQMSEAYAPLVGKPFNKVYERMLYYNETFWSQREKKNRLKKKFAK